jgi:GDP-4-dehydro-6-deoxy-D-mannose reductase
MAPVLITGAAGFAGRWLGAACRRNGDEVVGLGLAPEPGGPASWVSCDITDAGVLDAAIAQIRPRITYHLAAIAAPALANADQRRAWTVNLLGTLNVLASLARHSPGSHILLVSSAAVYGSVERSACPLPESHPATPADCYGATKRAAELAVLGDPGAGLQVHVARAFNHLGPGQSVDFLPGKLARAVTEIRAGRAPPSLSLGSLQDWRDLTDVRDVVRAYRAIVDRGKPGRIYNVCSGNAIPMAELVSCFCDLAGIPIEVDTGAAHPDSALPFLEGDCSRLRRDCGWRPEIPLRQSVLDALAQPRPGLPRDDMSTPQINP